MALPKEAQWDLGETSEGQSFELRLREGVGMEVEFSIRRTKLRDYNDKDTVDHIPLDIMQRLATIINDLKP